MASTSCRPCAAVCVIIIMFASQTWSCAAYNNQQQKWLTKQLTQISRSATTSTRGSASGTAHAARHLGESTTVDNGWRANLVNEDHRLHDYFDLSNVERIASGVQQSKSRARALDSRARAAPFSVGPGRKTLQTDEGSTSSVTKAPGLRRKARQSTSSPSFESTVYVTPGAYSMSISIGTPAQNFIAIADTGSDLVWIQGAACTVCFNGSSDSPRFDPAVSTTYTDIGCTPVCSNLGRNQLQCAPNCQYTYSYGDQSTTVGNYALDTVTLLDSAGVATLIPDFQFGVGIQNQGTFTDTDGIIGLGRGPISFPSQIASYLNNVNKFSYCFVSRYDETSTSPIIFGAAAVPTNVTGVSYTPLLTPYEASVVPYYYVNLLCIIVGDTEVIIPDSALQIDANNGNGGTIFDSGTTYTVLNTDAYTPVLDAFIAQITAYQQVNLTDQVGLDLCYDISGLSSVSVPNLVFHFENADFDLPFDNIFILFSTGQASYMCLTLLESQGLNIYGNSQQQNFQVVYEEDTKQIGWVPLDCGTL